MKKDAAHKKHIKMGKKPLKRVWRKKIADGACVKCCICFHIIKHEWELTADHINPRQAGGHSWNGNIAPAHRWCNAFKANMPIDLARALMAFYPDREYWYKMSITHQLDGVYKHFSLINDTKKHTK